MNLEIDGIELGWKEEIQINERTGQTERTGTAVCAAHLIACSMIPFMLRGILKSAGSLVDKLWTCFEYELFRPEQRLRRWLIGLISPIEGCSFEYFTPTVPIWIL